MAAASLLSGTRQVPERVRTYAPGVADDLVREGNMLSQSLRDEAVRGRGMLRACCMHAAWPYGCGGPQDWLPLHEQRMQAGSVNAHAIKISASFWRHAGLPDSCNGLRRLLQTPP